MTPKKPYSSPVEVPLTVPAGVISSFIGISLQRVGQLVSESKLPKPAGKGQFLFRESVLAYIETLRAKKAEVLADKARKEKADADSAEMKALREGKKLVFRSDSRHAWANTVAQGVRGISRIQSLTTAQKEEVFAVLRSIDPPEVQEEEDGE